ncbi:MAG: hypothetical protein HC895_17885 [Leptolyngbyaceae cyanobacterium SM1_3_5]|nr:hypothetical protein [Leptolyngbyaceae cyanobacterium SM1_3_5]
MALGIKSGTAHLFKHFLEPVRSIYLVLIEQLMRQTIDRAQEWKAETYCWNGSIDRIAVAATR